MPVRTDTWYVRDRKRQKCQQVRRLTKYASKSLASPQNFSLQVGWNLLLALNLLQALEQSSLRSATFVTNYKIHFWFFESSFNCINENRFVFVIKYCHAFRSKNAIKTPSETIHHTLNLTSVISLMYHIYHWCLTNYVLYSSSVSVYLFVSLSFL